MLDQYKELIKAKNADKVSTFDIELLDATLAILMDLEIDTKNRFLSSLVLSSHEFEYSEQIKSFLPQFLGKMTHDQMKIEVYNTLLRYTETENFITKIIDNESTPDFLKQVFIPTIKKVFLN